MAESDSASSGSHAAPDIAGAAIDVFTMEPYAHLTLG